VKNVGECVRRCHLISSGRIKLKLKLPATQRNGGVDVAEQTPRILKLKFPIYRAEMSRDEQRAEYLWSIALFELHMYIIDT
jgi:hypothetical protein